MKELKEINPIADRDMRLEELSFIASQKKKLTEEENKLKRNLYGYQNF